MEKSKNNILKIVAIILAVAIVVAGVVVGLKFKDKFTSGFGAEVTTTEDTIEELTTEEPTTEEPTTEFDTSVYDGILEKYRKAIKDAKNGNISFDETYLLCPDPNMFAYEEAEFLYTYFDINNDGIPEMIFAEEDRYDGPLSFDNKNVFNIWKYEDGEVKEFRKDSVYGYRSCVDVCKNNILKEFHYPGNGTDVYIFYDITDAKEPVVIESIVAFNNWVDSTDVRYAHVDGKVIFDEYEITEDEYVSKEEFDSIMSKYISVSGFEWIDFRLN